MKKIVVLTMVLMGLAACKTTTDVPRLDIEMPQSLKKNKELKEFVLQAQKDANQLAAKCVKMHAQAEPFLDADFDTMDPEQQEALVKLDLDYVEMWYTFNVKATTRSLKTLQYIQDQTVLREEKIDLSQTMALINQFIEDLKVTYGEDMQLDPYPASEGEAEAPSETGSSEVSNT
jgi:hypothetical protein